MQARITVLGLLPLVFIGCTTLGSNKLTERTIAQIASREMVAFHCENHGHYPQGVASAFTDLVHQLHRQERIDREVFINYRVEAVEYIFSARDAGELEGFCTMAWPGIPDMYQTMVGIENGRNQPRHTTYTPQQQSQVPQILFTPPPQSGSNQPTFGLPERNTRHTYEDGQIRSCTETSSGVDVCR